jgi:DMSO/TMAO reductase YedYZ molybdopterin-dependent catalytic subunit
MADEDYPSGDAAGRLPPNQALLPPRRWPVVGESAPRPSDMPWTITLAGLVDRPVSIPLDELRAWPRRRYTVDIHCVTRWSKLDMEFEGLDLAELLARAGVSPDARFASFVARSERNHSTSLPLETALSLGAFVALGVQGGPLPEEHGGPVRMVVPGRYFYKSVKWLERIELLAEDRLGYWEGETGYHNNADPWREERYIVAGVRKLELKALVQARDFSGRDLLSVQADRMDLRGLNARKAVLRNASFRRADLSGADFAGANLSNGHLEGADLRGAVFRGADLEGANFRGADLRGADFSGASLFGASFCPEPEDREAWGEARLDGSTRIEPEQLEKLSDAQAAFLTRALGWRA